MPRALIAETIDLIAVLAGRGAARRLDELADVSALRPFYDRVTSKGAVALDDYARRSDPVAQIGKSQVAVDVASVIRASNDSLRVAWAARHYADDVLTATERWSAILTIVVKTPSDADQLKKTLSASTSTPSTGQRSARAAQLREHKPHPVAAFPACRQLRQHFRKDRRLGSDEAFQVERIGGVQSHPRASITRGTGRCWPVLLENPAPGAGAASSP